MDANLNEFGKNKTFDNSIFGTIWKLGATKLFN